VVVIVIVVIFHSKFVIVVSDSWSERENHRGVREVCVVRSLARCKDQPCDPDGYRWPPTFSNWLKTVF
jgi:hypothetical protein